MAEIEEPRFRAAVMASAHDPLAREKAPDGACRQHLGPCELERSFSRAETLQARTVLRLRSLSTAAVFVLYMPMNPELRENGYLPVKALLEPTLARVIYKTFLLQQWRREAIRDNHMPTAASVANTALTDALLLELRPKIESIAACNLVPTYSYARVYFHGDTMVRHQDRESCEVSVSIHLARDGGDASLWFQQGAKVEMEPGDGAVYLGYQTEHWRERFTGNAMGQIFLHYVTKGGRFAAHYFDGRPHRFPPSISDGRA